MDIMPPLLLFTLLVFLRNTHGCPCITDCNGKSSGSYTSCISCNVYATCSNGVLLDNRPCPVGLEWDQSATGCVYSSGTCPCAEPTPTPTLNPTKKPTTNPTLKPTANPTQKPISNPTLNPTSDATLKPTAIPTQRVTSNPTFKPTRKPIATYISTDFTDQSSNTDETTNHTFNPTASNTFATVLNPSKPPNNDIIVSLPTNKPLSSHAVVTAQDPISTTRSMNNTIIAKTEQNIFLEHAILVGVVVFCLLVCCCCLFGIRNYYKQRNAIIHINRQITAGSDIQHPEEPEHDLLNYARKNSEVVLVTPDAIGGEEDYSEERVVKSEGHQEPQTFDGSDDELTGDSMYDAMNNTDNDITTRGDE